MRRMFKRKSYRSLIIAFCFLSPVTVLAQYDTIVADTVIQEEIRTEDNFKKLDPADTSFITERHLPAEQVNKYKKDKAFWYVDKEAQKEKPKDPENKASPEYT